MSYYDIVCFVYDIVTYDIVCKNIRYRISPLVLYDIVCLTYNIVCWQESRWYVILYAEYTTLLPLQNFGANMQNMQNIMQNMQNMQCKFLYAKKCTAHVAEVDKNPHEVIMIWLVTVERLGLALGRVACSRDPVAASPCEWATFHVALLRASPGQSPTGSLTESLVPAAQVAQIQFQCCSANKPVYQLQCTANAESDSTFVHWVLRCILS